MAYRKISWKLENCNKLEEQGNVDLGKLRRLFLSLDGNGKGKTSIYGLGSVLKDPSLQMSENAIAAFITDFHVNRTRTEGMDICEFFDMIEATNFSERYFKQLIHMAIIRQTAIRNDFQRYDHNGDGCITTKQFRIIMRKQKIRVTEEEIDTMIKDADYDMNGKVNYDEFSLVITE